MEPRPRRAQAREGKPYVWLALVIVCLLVGCGWLGDRQLKAQQRTNRLFQALHQDNAAAVQSVLTEGSDPNARQSLSGDVPMDFPGIVKQLFSEFLHPSGSETALTEAVQVGDPQIVRILLEHGAAPNLRNSDGSTPFLFAACQHYPSPERFSSASVGERSGNQTRIHLMQMLLDHGADVNARDRNGSTALEASATSVAADGRSDEDVDVTIPRFLLEHGANVNVKVPAGDGDTGDPDASLLYTVAASGNKSAALARLLLDHGANVNAVSGTGSTPLAIAGERSEPGMMKMLLKYGANPNVHPPNGDTPLTEAVEQGQKGIIQLLLDHRADVSDGAPVVVAMVHKRTDIVQLLLDRGADPNDALGEAVTSGSVPYVQLLLAHGAKPNLGTPLIDAVSGCLIAAYRKRSNNNVEVGDWTQILPVTPPCGTTIPQMLLAAGADPNKVNDTGETALLYAVAGHNAPLVRLLLASGANPNPPGAMGLTPDHSLLTYDSELTPIGLATQRGYSDLLPLLRQKPQPRPRPNPRTTAGGTPSG